MLDSFRSQNFNLLIIMNAPYLGNSNKLFSQSCQTVICDIDFFKPKAHLLNKMGQDIQKKTPLLSTFAGKFRYNTHYTS